MPVIFGRLFGLARAPLRNAIDPQYAAPMIDIDPVMMAAGPFAPFNGIAPGVLDSTPMDRVDFQPGYFSDPLGVGPKLAPLLTLRSGQQFGPDRE